VTIISGPPSDWYRTVQGWLIATENGERAQLVTRPTVGVGQGISTLPRDRISGDFLYRLQLQKTSMERSVYAMLASEPWSGSLAVGIEEFLLRLVLDEVVS
jgi:hypothetical protein